MGYLNTASNNPAQEKLEKIVMLLFFGGEGRERGRRSILVSVKMVNNKKNGHKLSACRVPRPFIFSLSQAPKDPKRPLRRRERQSIEVGDGQRKTIAHHVRISEFYFTHD